MSNRLLAATAAALLPLFGALAAPMHARHTDKGIVVDLTITPLAGADLREGAPARITLKFTDATTGAKLRGINPAAWFSARENAAHPSGRTACEAKIAAFLGGNLFSEPSLDLNVYDVVTLNEDPTLSVVDPRFSVGGSTRRGLGLR